MDAHPENLVTNAKDRYATSGNPTPEISLQRVDWFSPDQFSARVSMMIQKKKLLCRWILLVALSTAFVESSHGQPLSANKQRDSSRTLLTRKNLITAGIVAHTVITFTLEYQWWWKGNYHPFGFIREGFWHDYSLGVDKFGHFYTHYVYFHALYNFLRWGEYNESQVLWVSTIVSALYGLSLEIGDGYSSNLFSPEDLAADFLGIAYGALQTQIPFMGNFKFKWSYYPSGYSSNSFNHPFSNDYDGHIYWLSFNVHNLFPQSLSEYWPKFLNVAVGYGGRNIWIGSTGPQFRKLAIALDYNLTTIPLNNDTWEVVKNIVDLFHFPAPGIRFIQEEPVEVKPLLLK